MSENPYAPYTVTQDHDEELDEVNYAVAGPGLSLEYDNVFDAKEIAFLLSVAFNAGKSDAIIIDGVPKNPAAFEALYRACRMALGALQIECDAQGGRGYHPTMRTLREALALADKE